MNQEYPFQLEQTAALREFLPALRNCRFCPMCKVAAEVANLTLVESYSTRARAMMLWRWLDGTGNLTSRHVELLYQSTLDSISEAWCVSHSPVSSYVAEARALVYESGLAPRSVLAALERETPESPERQAEVLLLGGETAEWGEESVLQPAVTALRNGQLKDDLTVMVVASGALAYSLGARELARRQAKHVADRIASSGASEVIADGPQTLWAVRRLYPVLGVTIPENIKVTSLSETIAKQPSAIHSRTDRRAMVLDSRSACQLADRMASGEAIHPGFQGPETSLGAGEVYEAPRRVIDLLGMKRIHHVWSRCLAKSCGADDGLWLTYPDLAQGLARQWLEKARRLQAEVLVTDSLLSARYLLRNSTQDDVPVRWLPEFVAQQ